MSKKLTDGEVCNLVWLAGKVEQIRLETDESAYFAVSTGDQVPAIPCAIDNNQELTRQLQHFLAGDYIKLIGYFGPLLTHFPCGFYCVRVTEIKNNPPQRAKAQRDNTGLPWQQ